MYRIKSKSSKILSSQSNMTENICFNYSFDEIFMNISFGSFSLHEKEENE